SRRSPGGFFSSQVLMTETNLDQGVLALRPLGMAVCPAPPVPEVPPGWLAQLNRLRAQARTEKTGAALLVRSELCYRLGRDQEALADLEVSLKALPTFPPPYLLRALIHARGGRTKQARQDLAR